jgi:hypothetical protein
MGHSQGGMVVQLAQQELQARGSSLREERGVRHAILFASVGPRGLPWSFVDAGTAGAVLAPFVSFDPALGVHFYMPPSLWPLLVFTTPAGVIVPGAPSGAEIAARGYDSPEPIAALGELLGTPPAQRPYVSPGAFAEGNGTKLDVVAFAADAIIRPAESEALYTYLTGEPACSGFTTVNGADLVHGAIISSPGAILSAIEDRVALP